MKKNSFAILYIVIVPIILGGLVLFVFRYSVLDILRQKTGVDSAARVITISSTPAKVASSSALDTSILKLPRFVTLVNQVANFNFDNICWRPDVVTSQPTVSPVAGIAGEATSTGEITAANCVRGNNLPFSVKK